MTDPPSAAWLPDPAGRAQYRWWDGTQWTDQIASGGVPSVDTEPLDPSTPPPPPGAPEPPRPSHPAGSDDVTEELPVQADESEPVVTASPDDDPRRRSVVVPVALAIAAVVAIGAGALLLFGGDDAEPTTVEALLEPAAGLGPDPFTDEFAAQPVVTIDPDIVAPIGPDAGGAASTTTSSEASTSSSSTSTAAPRAEGLVRVNASTPGLYGGTQDNESCNTSQLQTFLAGNPAKATAWVDALNGDGTVTFRGGSLTADDIEDYIDTLTPVVLLADTLVVNHGYSDGRATPRDAVLQKGSAVLVDNQGVPRTRCACGNPLTQPSSSVTQVEPQGTPWPGYNPNKVAVVEPFPGGMTTLSVVDLGSGVMFQRPIGSKGERDIPPPTTTTTTTTTEPTTTTTVVLGTGDVQATLRWNTDADLDLHVIDPGGEEIAWTAPTSGSGGQLDVDDVPNLGDNGPHVENIFWPPGEAPNGTFQIWVRHFSGAPSEYTLEVRNNDQIVHSESGTLSEGQDSAIYEFSR
jgi:hypothetical protein